MKAPMMPGIPTPEQLAERMGLSKTSSRSKARLYIATLAVLRLGLDSSNRNELFAPNTSEQSRIPALRREGLSKSWQQEFLNRLVTTGVAAENTDFDTGAKSYTIGSDAKHTELAGNILLTEDKVELRRLLWPEDHLVPSEPAEEPEQLDTEDLEDGDQVVAVGTTEELSLIGAVATQLKVVAQHLGSIHAATATHDAKLGSVSTSLVGTVDAFKAVVAALDKSLEARREEERVKLLELMARLLETDARKRSLLNQLEGESRKAEELIRAINERVKK